MKTAAFPTISNAFKPFAWNGDLQFKEVTLWKVVLVSWGIALFEYCCQVSANRIGHQSVSAPSSSLSGSGRSVRTLTIGLLLLLSASSYAQRPALRTYGAGTLGGGLIEITVGSEYSAKSAAPFPEAPRTLWKVPMFSVRWGAAANVDFEFAWSGKLLAGYAGGSRGSDWGDPVVGTVFRAFDEHDGVPAVGLRTAVKLPSTSFLPYYLGSDQTDFSFALVASRHAGTVEMLLDLGLGIIGNPRELGSQDDIYIASAALVIPAGEGIKLFLEGYGMSGYKEDDDKLLVRSGALSQFGCWHVNVYGSVRAAGSNKDFGAAFSSSEDWSAGVSCSKDFSL